MEDQTITHITKDQDSIEVGRTATGKITFNVHVHGNLKDDQDKILSKVLSIAEKLVEKYPV